MESSSSIPSVLMCSDIQCEKNCGFSGGYSGYCSSCWRSLNEEEKKAATQKQMTLEPERQKRRDERLKEENAKREAEKRERDAEIEKERESLMKKVKSGGKRKSGECSLIFSSSEAFDLESDFKYMPIAPEVWSCGVGVWNGEDGEEEEHNHTTTAAQREDLIDAVQKMTDALKGVALPASEGGEPIVGFIVSKDLPSVRALGEDATTDQIIRASFSLPGDEYGGFEDDMPLSASAFPRFEDFTEENAAKMERAFKQLVSRSAEGGFTTYGPVDDNYVGPVIVAAKTESGDVLGVVGWLVWT